MKRKKYYSSLHIKRVKVVEDGKSVWRLRTWRSLLTKIKFCLSKRINGLRDIFFTEFEKGKVTETISESFFQLDKLGRLRRKRMPEWNEKKLIALSITTEEGGDKK